MLLWARAGNDSGPKRAAAGGLAKAGVIVERTHACPLTPFCQRKAYGNGPGVFKCNRVESPAPLFCFDHVALKSMDPCMQATHQQAVWAVASVS